MTYSAQFIDHGGTRGRISWALYDWAGQAFHTLIVTFVFAAYFSQAIVGDDLRGQELWGTASSISGLLLAILAPIVGAIAHYQFATIHPYYDGNGRTGRILNILYMEEIYRILINYGRTFTLGRNKT